ncbi:MAG: hypothetical protein HQ523_08455 [Lentisphaerae bacterium]|nr:hypothetical protein [Lentisphaerota bacterium]
MSKTPTPQSTATPQALAARHKQILSEMGGVIDLRRGSLSPQYYTKTDTAGKRYRQGPYYMLTYYRDCRKHTDRVPQADVPTVETQVNNYRKMKALFDELIDVTDQLTRLRQEASAGKS